MKLCIAMGFLVAAATEAPIAVMAALVVISGAWAVGTAAGLMIDRVFNSEE